MARKRAPQPEYWCRTVQIDGVDLSVGVRVHEERGLAPSVDAGPWMHLRGIVDEPVKDVLRARFSLYPVKEIQFGPFGPPGIGAIIGIRAEVDAVIQVPPTEFDQMWVLAVGGQLKFASLAFAKPLRGKARIFRFDVSSVREE